MPSEVPSAGRFLAGVALPAGAAATSQDPVDIATMFAKLRNTLPIGLAVYTPELNKGEAEWIAQRNRERDWEEAQRTNRRELTPEEQVRNFEWQYPGTIERQLMLEYLRRQQEKQLPGPRRAPPAQPVALQEVRAIEPRRKADGGSVKQSQSDVNPPEGAQEFIDAIRKKFASGGAVGVETTPDMSDGGNVIPVPEVGMAGGGDPGKKLKSVASMFKTLEKEPDLARRALFKLPESANLPATIEKQSLPGMKDAPKVTEKTVELDPGEGKKKVTVKSLAETPVSRREVLQSAASQVARRALPDVLSADAARIVPEDLLRGANDWPSVYQAMLPVVARHAPQEIKTLPERLGVTVEDLLRASEEDPFVRSMPETMLRFQELFPETFMKAIGKSGGGFIKGLKKPVSTETPDLARRSIFGLRPESPLATSRPSLGIAPKVPESYTSSPLQEITKKVSEIPLSRREVLRKAGETALSQVAKGAIPAAVRDVVPSVARSAVSNVDDMAVVSKISDYVSSVFSDRKLANKVFAGVFDEKPHEYFGYRADLPEIWQELEEASPSILKTAAKLAGLDVNTISTRTGLPVSAVQRFVSEDGGIMNDLIRAAGTRSHHQAILEDPRPKGTWMSTAYHDVFGDPQFMNQAAENALKDLGSGASEDELLNHINKAAYNRWAEMERGAKKFDPVSKRSEYSPVENPLSRTIQNRVVDDKILGSSWKLAMEDNGDILEQIFGYLQKNGWVPAGEY